MPAAAPGKRLPGVLGALFAARGSLIGRSPMYGRAEAVTGVMPAVAGQRDQAFVATRPRCRSRRSSACNEP